MITGWKHWGVRASIAAALVCCVPSVVLAEGDGEFLTFKDAPSLPKSSLSQSNLAHSITLPSQPLPNTPRVISIDNRLSVDGPAPTGLFTPRYAASQVPVFGNRQAALEDGGVALSLTSRPITLAGMSSGAQDANASWGDQSYNLGFNLGISRFQFAAAVSRLTDVKHEFGLTGLEVDMRYLGEDWETSLALSGSQATTQSLPSLGQGLGLVHDQSFAVEWGASYLLTPRLSLGGSVRLSGFRDDAWFGENVTTDSAIFLGTNLKF